MCVGLRRRRAEGEGEGAGAALQLDNSWVPCQLAFNRLATDRDSRYGRLLHQWWAFCTEQPAVLCPAAVVAFAEYFERLLRRQPCALVPLH